MPLYNCPEHPLSPLALSDFAHKVLGHFPLHFKSHPLIYPPTSVGLENRVQWKLVDFVFSDKSFPKGGGEGGTFGGYSQFIYILWA